MKVWVVTTVEYSEMEVVGVFSSLEKAMPLVHAELCNDPVEYELDAETPQWDPERAKWNVQFEAGDSADVYHVNRVEESCNQWWFWSETPRMSGWTSASNVRLAIGVRARDAQHAVKIASEKRAQLIALVGLPIPYNAENGEILLPKSTAFRDGHGAGVCRGDDGGGDGDEHGGDGG